MSTSFALKGEIAVPSVDAAAAKAGIVGWLSRVHTALMASRRRKADAEVAHFIAANGGVLTDDLERAISRRYGNIVGG